MFNIYKEWYMNKLLKREFLPVGTESQTYSSKSGQKEVCSVRKRWFASMECMQCGEIFTILEQSKKKHLHKPCETCAKKNAAYKSFISKALKKHGNKFDYSLITQENYVNLFTPVKIMCKEHGYFLQKPKDHTSKTNAKLCCPICVQEFNKVHNKRSIESWKEELNDKAPHISMTEHGNADSNMEDCVLECKHHGKFTSKLCDIKNQKYICPLCSQDHNSWGGRFRRTDVAGILYFIELPTLGVYKLGVTSKSTEERLRSLKHPYNVLWEVKFPTLKDAYEKETYLFRKFKDFRRDRNAEPLLGKCKGNSELVTCLIPKTAIQCSNALSKEP